MNEMYVMAADYTVKVRRNGVLKFGAHTINTKE